MIAPPVADEPPANFGDHAPERADVRPIPDLSQRDGEIFVTQPLPIVTSQDSEESAEIADAEGTTFGDYTLLDRIAVGGMAEVWRARRRGVEGFQKTVAIKKILAHLTDSSDFVTMLIDEAKLAAQLNHHNIIQIYDLGKVGDDFFIAMEYVEGKDLRSILEVAKEKNRPLPVGLTLLIVDAVARALDYAHRKRDFEDRQLELVHRDVSPQNVLISYEGEIKLCDFGIVKAVSKASTTQMGALKGKLQYMSPEQAWGRSVDARSDIFSLGSVFFELLTGSKLFTGDSEISVLDAVRECRPRSPREILPTIPKEVESIVLKALAKNPDDRYQRASDMEHDIKSVLDLIKPTPGLKDLAAHMDALFRRPDLATTAPTPAPVTGAEASAPAAKAPKAAAPAAVAARPVTRSSQIRPPQPQKKTGGGKRILTLVAAAVLVGVLAGAGYFFLREPTSGSGPAEPAPATETTAAPATASPPPATAAPAEASATGPAETSATDPAKTSATEPDAGDIEPGDGEEAASEEPVTAGEATGGEQEVATEPGAAEDSEMSLDLEQLVAEEVSKRRQEMERDFEERKRLLEEEIEKAKKDAAGDEGGGDG